MSGRRVRVVEVRVPGDKSITHRALLLAALAHGTSRVRRALAGEDTEATAGVLRSLGCAMPELGAAEVLEIDGLGLGGLRAPAATLDCANSGTTARLLLGVLGGHPFRAKLTGDTSLRSRPMRRVTGPLSQMGAVFRELGEPDRLPIEVEGGRLRPLDFASPRSSAQVKSALLLAG
ncbi:MAG: 3-phosphoshikimate 1-carboxyvinyltransferase, partial [Gemmatimonadetes bacterium]|nr:3-phosphoshikimate 1-carboxyvinyltransferase [Gemmatimonadota bacterium]